MSGFLGKVGEFLGGAGGGIIKQVSEVADTFIQTKEEKAEFKLKLKELEHKIQQESKQLEADIQESYLKDTQDARAMQVAALSQEDKFSKRFVYIFAIGLSAATFILVGMLMFVEIPEHNRSIVDMAIGALVATGLIQVIQFFFGSSKGSKDKADATAAKEALDAVRNLKK
jgi:lipopolysaccharide export LptBFGC system permease protein LptF